MTAVMRIAKDNVAIEFVCVYLCADIHIRTYSLAHLDPITLHTPVFSHEPFLLVRRINEAVNDLSLTSTQQYAVRAMFCAHLIYNIGIAVFEVEFFKRLLPRLNAQSHLVCIVEEQQSSQHRTLTHTLCAGKVHVTVQHYLSVWDVGTIQKNDSIQMSHTSGVSSSL